MKNQSAILSVEYKVNFDNSHSNVKHDIKKQSTSETTSPQIPRIAKLLALAHHFQDLIDNGVVKDYADIARLSGLSRARITQITNLTLLAPEIQEEILTLLSTITQKESNIRLVLRTPIWKYQLNSWALINNSLPKN